MQTIISNPIFTIGITVGSILLLVGFIMHKWPPKTINSLYGYRTSSSMKNQERWDFSQLYSAKEMMKAGFAQMLSSFIAFSYTPTKEIATYIGLGFMVIFMIIMIFRTELAIAKKFKK